MLQKILLALTISLSVTSYIHGKNGFAEILKNLARDMKIILLLNYQNNYIWNSSIMKNIKKFDILIWYSMLTTTYGKNNFVKVFKSLARYSFKNNFVQTIRIHNYVGRSN